MELKNPLMVELTDEQKAIGNCLYKIYCGKKYLIIKAKALLGSLIMLQNGYEIAMEPNSKLGKYGVLGTQKEWQDKKNQYYFKFYKYITRWAELPRRIEVLLQTDNQFELLKAEQEALEATFRDKKCLNNNIEAYIPKFNEKTGMYNWITADAVNSFRQYQQEKLQVSQDT